MKNKYIPVIAITVALSSSLFAFNLAAQPSTSQHLADQEYSQLRMIDQRLADKVVEFLELSDLLADQLNQARLAKNRDSKALLLVGDQKEAAPAQKAAPTEPVVNKAPAKSRPTPPWWAGYRLNMIMVSNGVRSAVINNRYLQAGDMLRHDIRVRQVEQGRVVLERSGQVATLYIK